MKSPGIAPGLFTHWATRWIAGALMVAAVLLLIFQASNGAPLGGWTVLTGLLAVTWIYARFCYGREVVTGQWELVGKPKAGSTST